MKLKDRLTKFIVDYSVVIFVFAMVSLIGTLFAGWFNHVITCFQDDSWSFLIAGALFAPLGALHGIWLWFI